MVGLREEVELREESVLYHFLLLQHGELCRFNRLFSYLHRTVVGSKCWLHHDTKYMGIVIRHSKIVMFIADKDG
jgi:hypothetical protein